MYNAVVGFMFDPQGKRVVLINKTHPEWQKGLWNGVGGEVQTYRENAREAMAREFQEETGVETDPSQWVIVVIMSGRNSETGEDWTITFLYSCTQYGAEHSKTVTDELVEIHPVDNLPGNLVRGLRWIIPLCLEKIDFPLVVRSR